MAVYRAVGFSPRALRLSFSLRFGLVAATGALLGLAAGAAFADQAIGLLLRSFGIGAFRAEMDAVRLLFPGLLVALLFAIFAALFSRGLKERRLSATLAD